MKLCSMKVAPDAGYVTAGHGFDVIRSIGSVLSASLECFVCDCCGSVVGGVGLEDDVAHCPNMFGCDCLRFMW